MSRPLTATEAEFLRRLPLRDAVHNAPQAIEEGMRLRMIASLRQRKLISIALDWNASTRGLAFRDIALTEAGLAALKEHGR